MTGLFLDVLQIKAGYSIVCAYGVNRLIDAFPQFTIENEENFGGRVVALQVVEHLRHCRAEIVELFRCPVAIDVVADW